MLDNAPGGPLQNWNSYLREALFSENRGGSCPLASLPQATSPDPQLNFPSPPFPFRSMDVCYPSFIDARIMS